MTSSLRGRVAENLPLVPLQAYEVVSRLQGGYPESGLLRISSLLGQPKSRHISRYSHHWAEYELFKTPASICQTTATWLWRCLDKAKPKFIIEFGTGFSTLVMLSYAQYALSSGGGPAEILSIEHDGKWFESQRSLLKNLDPFGYVHLVHSPLGRVTCFGEDVVSYTQMDNITSRLGLHSKADFIFVDGPLGLEHGGEGRRGSILQSIDLAEPGATILVHDALRSEEFSCIREFQKRSSLHFLCHGIVPLWYGLAVCGKKRPET